MRPELTNQWYYLAVDPPDRVPSPRTPADTRARLARNVAVLFGVDVPGNPTGMTWVCDFNRVTVSEVGRGAPNPPRGVRYALDSAGLASVDRGLVLGPARAVGRDDRQPAEIRLLSPDATLDEISPATLQRFGPETKAAVVLAGARELLDSLEATIVDVLEILGVSIDGQPLADVMRIAAWAFLVAETYRTQPALFVAALQARDIQRGALANWAPLADRLEAHVHARAEFSEDDAHAHTSAGRMTNDEYRPSTIRIIDDVLRDHVRPAFDMQPSAQRESDAESGLSLTADLAQRWCDLLVRTQESGVAWTIEDPRDGRRTVDITLPLLGVMGTYVAQVIQQLPAVLPYGADALRDNFEVLDLEKPEHRQRLLPRIVTLPELRRLPDRTQRAVLNTHVFLLRLARTHELFRSAAMVTETLADMGTILEHAAALWGETDTTTTMFRLIHSRFTPRVQRSAIPKARVRRARATHLANLEDVRQLWKSGAMPAGAWLDVLNTESSTLHSIARDLESEGDSTGAQDLHTRLVTWWDEALRAVGLGDIPDGVPVEELSLDSGFTVILHNYGALILDSAEPDLQWRGFELLYRRILPMRREIARVRQSNKPVRQTIQLLIRRIGRIVGLHQGSRREQLLNALVALTREFRELHLVNDLLTGNSKTGFDSDVLTMLSFAEGTMTLVEEGAVPLSEKNLEEVRNALLVGATSMEASRYVKDRGPVTRRLHQLERDQARLDALTQTLAHKGEQ